MIPGRSHDINIDLQWPVPISLAVVLVALGFASRRVGNAFASLFRVTEALAAVIKNALVATFAFIRRLGFNVRRQEPVLSW